jgi:hypothetical protein
MPETSSFKSIIDFFVGTILRVNQLRTDRILANRNQSPTERFHRR